MTSVATGRQRFVTFFPSQHACRKWFRETMVIDKTAASVLVETMFNKSLLELKDIDVPRSQCTTTKVLIGVLNTMTNQYMTCGTVDIAKMSVSKSGMIRVRVVDCAMYDHRPATHVTPAPQHAVQPGSKTQTSAAVTTVFFGRPSPSGPTAAASLSLLREQWLVAFGGYTTPPQGSPRKWSDAQVCQALRLRLQILVKGDAGERKQGFDPVTDFQSFRYLEALVEATERVAQKSLVDMDWRSTIHEWTAARQDWSDRETLCLARRLAAVRQDKMQQRAVAALGASFVRQGNRVSVEYRNGLSLCVPLNQLPRTWAILCMHDRRRQLDAVPLQDVLDNAFWVMTAISRDRPLLRALKRVLHIDFARVMAAAKGGIPPSHPPPTAPAPASGPMRFELVGDCDEEDDDDDGGPPPPPPSSSRDTDGDTDMAMRNGETKRHTPPPPSDNGSSEEIKEIPPRAIVRAAVDEAKAQVAQELKREADAERRQRFKATQADYAAFFPHPPMLHMHLPVRCAIELVREQPKPLLVELTNKPAVPKGETLRTWCQRHKSTGDECDVTAFAGNPAPGKFRHGPFVTDEDRVQFAALPHDGCNYLSELRCLRPDFKDDSLSESCYFSVDFEAYTPNGTWVDVCQSQKNGASITGVIDDVVREWCPGLPSYAFGIKTASGVVDDGPRTLFAEGELCSKSSYTMVYGKTVQLKLAQQRMLHEAICVRLDEVFGPEGIYGQPWRILLDIKVYADRHGSRYLFHDKHKLIKCATCEADNTRVGGGMCPTGKCKLIKANRPQIPYAWYSDYRRSPESARAISFATFVLSVGVRPNARGAKQPTQFFTHDASAGAPAHCMPFVPRLNRLTTRGTLLRFGGNGGAGGSVGGGGENGAGSGSNGWSSDGMQLLASRPYEVTNITDVKGDEKIEGAARRVLSPYIGDKIEFATLKHGIDPNGVPIYKGDCLRQTAWCPYGSEGFMHGENRTFFRFSKNYVWIGCYKCRETIRAKTRREYWAGRIDKVDILASLPKL